MKQNVIEFFQNLPVEKHEQFNTAFELYRKSPNKNLGVERSLNVQGFSESNLANLLYDLQKLHGITDVEKIKIQPKVVKLTDAVPPIIEIPEGIFDLPEKELLEWFDGVGENKVPYLEKAIEESGKRDSMITYHILIRELMKIEFPILPEYILNFSEDELRNWAKEKGIEAFHEIERIYILAVTENRNTISDILLEEMDILSYGTGAVVKKAGAVSEVTGAVDDSGQDTDGGIDVPGTEGTRPDNSHPGEMIVTDASLPLREEFPFLNDKDCPDAFKILVADKISAWKRYEAAHAQLLKIEAGEIEVTEEEKAALSKEALEAFTENTAIYEELNAYKETGKVLGAHPIFKTLQFQREVDEMNPEQLNKYIGASAKYFSDNKKSLAKAETENDTEMIEKINARVADREMKLALVNKKLGINK